MKWIFLSLVGLLSSCTIKIDGVCYDGPDKGSRLSAKASFNGFGTGTITAVAPWGEAAKGRYNTNAHKVSTAAWNAEARASGDSISAAGEDVVIESDGITQVGTATLLGDQGTIFDVIYWSSAFSPRHGQGRAKDSRGNRYRLLF